MLNSPSPYVPPTMPMGYAALPQTQWLTAGRRASVLMGVLGGLVLLLGFCNTLQAIVTPGVKLLEEQQRMFGSQNAAQMSADAYKALTVAVGGLTLGIGALLAGLSLGVRRGSRPATWVALILSILLAGLLALVTLCVLLLSVSAPGLMLMVVLPGIPLALMIWQVRLLIAAARVTGRVAAAQQAYAMQYWQHQQAMAAYGGGYGYAVPAALPPPANVDPGSGSAGVQ